MSRSAFALLVALGLVLSTQSLTACRGLSFGAEGTPTGAPARGTLAPPAGWRDSTPFVFERAALAWPAEDERGEALEDGALRELGDALGGQDESAVRAAVLLARSADPRAGRALLARLEQRERSEPPDGTRHGDAALVVAAAALWDWTVAPDQAERLARLAIGPEPFPDLEVRVECAASALHLGRDEVIPFLLRVMRARTPEEAESGIDWPSKRTVTWAKSRAAEALSTRAGVEVAFRPDGSYEHQREETARLAALLSEATKER